VTPGAHPDPARPGCPLPDADNDGVPDAEDACPKDAGEPNGNDPKANGCPKLTVTRGGSFELRSVHFETNKWELLPESFPILDEVTRFLNERKDLDEVVIEGHADDRGTREWNLRLSKHRAKSVVDYLVGKGIKRGRLAYVGYGDTRPLSTDRTDEARAQNRRVEVRFPEKK
jgi:outer membrane protein OmpA-like peptidoglycan-associated protein